jgi:hypothetical protein
MAKNIVFEWEALGNRAKGTKAVATAFERAGAGVASVNVDPKTKRAAGNKYREVVLTFNDSQMVTLRVKESGDIYQVVLNKTILPIANQDDHKKAVAEIVGKLEAGRSAFQQKLAKARVKPPPGMTTATPKIEDALTEKRDALVEAVDEARTTRDGLAAELAA